MPVVGTAGHVDHGKSTLVRALTGRDPDRWDEEKRRGLTIDLGFAWTTLPSGTEIGFVDVPGHEKFIKNMLAGVDAVNVVVFVVAADEGWMPQSEEHLAILDLLQISHGVIALTRTDLVDADRVELVTLEIDEMLIGTTLEGSPIIPMAAPAGAGVETLRHAIDAAVTSTSVPDVGRPRMWVDRSFVIEGAGTVVTGTLVDGAVSVNDTLQLFPGADPVRVRSIQSHERSLETVGPGNRAALNLAGVERTEIARGAMLGRKEDWEPTGRFLGYVRKVRALDEPLRERGSYHLHTGSGAWPVRLMLVKGSQIDSEGPVVMETASPLPLKHGDRFILREVGRQTVVAGGRVLDPDPPRRRRQIAPLVNTLEEARNPDEAADAILAGRGLARRTVIAAHSGGGSAAAAVNGVEHAYSAAKVADLLDQARSEAARFHEANPLRPGIPKARLAERLRLPLADLEALATAGEDLELTGTSVRLAGFRPDLSDEDRESWERARSVLTEAGFSPPRRGELDLPTELQHALIRSEQLIEVSGELLYLPETVAAVLELTRQMDPGFTVAQFRDSLGITRKHAVPLLEWLDASGVTVRQGDGRVLRPQPPS